MGAAIDVDQWHAKADAVEGHVDLAFDHQRLFWPVAVGFATEQFGADISRAYQQDFADRRNCRIGPDVSPCLVLVAGRKDLDDQHRIGQSALTLFVGNTVYRQIGYAHIRRGSYARYYARCRHDLASGAQQMVSEQPR